MQMDMVPPTQIFGVYQETQKLADAKEHAHKILYKRVSECTKLGRNVILMGDFNAPINETARPFNVASKKILEWKESGEISRSRQVCQEREIIQIAWIS